MNRVSLRLTVSLSTAHNACHPERSLAMREAHRQTQSKDPYSRRTASGQAGNLRIAIRFLDEHNTDYRPSCSREAETRL